MDDALIAAHRDLPALMPYLHLPVQSGSDRILDAMNRKHTARRLPPDHRAHPGRASPTSPCRPTSSSASRARPTRISTTHAARGGCRLSPSRFRSNTARAPARRRAGAGRSGAGGRQGRAAGAAAKAVGNPKRRLSISGTVGQTLDVLVEKPGRHPGQMAGKSPYLQPVQFETDRHACRRHRDGADRTGRRQQPVRGIDQWPATVSRRRNGRGI